MKVYGSQAQEQLYVLVNIYGKVEELVVSDTVLAS